MRVLNFVIAVYFVWLAGWTLFETKKVCAGWRGRPLALWSTKKSRSGSQQQFVAMCRRGLTFWAWFGLVWGAIMVTSDIVIIVFAGEYPIGTMLFGVALLTTSAVSFWCRRMLNAPAAAGA